MRKKWLSREIFHKKGKRSAENARQYRKSKKNALDQHTLNELGG